MDVLEIGKMKEKIRTFVSEREWGQYHTAKNISMALTIETNELMEIFLWLNDQEISHIAHHPTKIAQIEDEVADIFYWILRLCDHLNIDLQKVFWNKMKKNEEKYPIHLSKGNAKKYSELTK